MLQTIYFMDSIRKCYYDFMMINQYVIFLRSVKYIWRNFTAQKSCFMRKNTMQAAAINHITIGYLRRGSPNVFQKMPSPGNFKRMHK